MIFVINNFLENQKYKCIYIHDIKQRQDKKYKCIYIHDIKQRQDKKYKCIYIHDIKQRQDHSKLKFVSIILSKFM
jgi:hypothetical protein